MLLIQLARELRAFVFQSIQRLLVTLYLPGKCPQTPHLYFSNRPINAPHVESPFKVPICFQLYWKYEFLLARKSVQSTARVTFSPFIRRQRVEIKPAQGRISISERTSQSTERRNILFGGGWSGNVRKAQWSVWSSARFHIGTHLSLQEADVAVDLLRSYKPPPNNPALPTALSSLSTEPLRATRSWHLVLVIF